MRDKRMHPEIHIRAAQMALPFAALKPGDAKVGKKEQRLLDAAEVLTGGATSLPRAVRRSLWSIDSTETACMS